MVPRQAQTIFLQFFYNFFDEIKGGASGRPPKGTVAFGRRPLWLLYFIKKMKKTKVIRVIKDFLQKPKVLGRIFFKGEMGKL